MNSFSIFFFILIFFSCKNQNAPVVKKEYYDNGKLKSEITYIGNKKNGRALYYDVNGVIEREEHFTNDQNDSFITEYYANGKIENTTLYYGLIPTMSYTYYSNGQMELYNAIDCNDNTFYIVKFDSLGNKIKEDGMVISPEIGTSDYEVKGTTKSKEIYHIGDSVHLMFYVATPPGYIAKAYLEVFSLKNIADSVLGTAATSKEIVLPLNEHKIENSVVEYKGICTKAGIYKVTCYGELIDEKTKSTMKDKWSTLFTVK